MKRLLIDVNSIVPFYTSGKVSGISEVLRFISHTYIIKNVRKSMTVYYGTFFNRLILQARMRHMYMRLNNRNHTTSFNLSKVK